MCSPRSCRATSVPPHPTSPAHDSREVVVIDDPTTVATLIDRMQAALPIPAYPTKELVHTLREHGAKLSADRVLFIQRVFYHGDEGGIACDVTPTHGAKAVFVVSLTHLRLPPDHPLARDVRAYQTERVKRILESQQ